MPNTPALVGKGVSAITAGPGADDDDLEWAERILGSVGMTVRAPESHFDAVTGLTGSGPAYVFFVAEALIEAGEAAGLDPALVESMVSQLFVGSAALLAAQGDPAVTPRDGDLTRWHHGRRHRGPGGSRRPVGLRRCRARCDGTQP